MLIKSNRMSKCVEHNAYYLKKIVYETVQSSML